MKRSGAPRRRTKLAPVNRARRAKRQAEAFGLQAELCRTLSCAACGHPGPSEPAHVVSRGAGGKDRGNVIPLCSSDPPTGREGCHRAQHQRGWGGLYLCRLVPALTWRSDQAPVPVLVDNHVWAWAKGLARGLELQAYGGWE